MRIHAVASLAVACLVVAGCGRESSSARRSPGDPPRLVILGVDGFDWEIIDPLVESGRMPVMERTGSLWWTNQAGFCSWRTANYSARRSWT